MTLETKSIALEDEYKKETGIKPEDIKRLREWLDTQPHLPKDLISDLDLILVYHCCECSMQVSKQLLDLHFTLRAHLTCLFHNRVVDSSIERLLNNFLVTILPGRAMDGSAVLFGRLIDLDPKNLDFTPLLKAILMVIDVWQREEGSWDGFAIVIDLAGLSFGHLARLEVLPLQQVLLYVQEAMLVKLTGIHLMNAPSFMDKLMGMIKPFMKNELLAKLVIHETGATTLDKHVPAAVLPEEAGGQAGSVDVIKEQVLAKVRANKDFFLEENKKRVTEALRPGKPKTISDIFGGVEGSFKKLDID